MSTSLALAAALVFGQAFNQEGADLNDCQNSSPIAGTVGYRNALHALGTNAQSYGAATLAEEGLFPELAKEGGGLVYLYQSNMMFRAAEVPTVELSSGCPTDYKVSRRGLDLGAMGFGLGYRKDAWGLFYASSLVYSWSPFNSAALAPMSAMGAWMYASVGATLAPILPDYHQGVATVISDWIGGGLYDTGFGVVEAGYVGSKGLYVNAHHPALGVFGSLLYGGDSLSYGSGGIKRAEVPVVGKVSAYIQTLVLPNGGRVNDDGDLVQDEPGAAEDRHTSLDGALEDLAGVLDVGASYETKPRGTLRHVHAAIHSRDWSEPNLQGGLFLQGGWVDVPDQFYYGLEGGKLISGRLGMRAKPLEGLRITFALSYNDATTLLLFPYARNALHFFFALDG